ncbi:MAG TPA: hypothetical protein VLG91_21565, partial [Streptomyces sp.]|nr:hypothetical protein [Streptomyces sp.]
VHGLAFQSIDSIRTPGVQRPVIKRRTASAALRWHRTTATSFLVSICSTQDRQLLPKLLIKRCYFT